MRKRVHRLYGPNVCWTRERCVVNNRKLSSVWAHLDVAIKSPFCKRYIYCPIHPPDNGFACSLACNADRTTQKPTAWTQTPMKGLRMRTVCRMCIDIGRTGTHMAPMLIARSDAVFMLCSRTGLSEKSRPNRECSIFMWISNILSERNLCRKWTTDVDVVLCILRTIRSKTVDLLRKVCIVTRIIKTINWCHIKLEICKENGQHSFIYNLLCVLHGLSIS